MTIMDKVYIIEECIARGVWILLSDQFYTSRESAQAVLDEMIKLLRKFGKDLVGRVIELKPSKE